ncbi:hypothetical protein, partial [Paraburkholderia hospita]|uniref:hypothetical protein n=1 Tax=Paraburkholderia hospita TaxID=169430 RepID=UPI001A98F5CA
MPKVQHVCEFRNKQLDGASAAFAHQGAGEDDGAGVARRRCVVFGAAAAAEAASDTPAAPAGTSAG